MKIIDEQGKLFGRINLIDFLAILFLLFFALIGYKLWAGKKKAEVELKEKTLKQSLLKVDKREFLEIDLHFVLNKLTPRILGLIAVGDKELDESGQVIGEIISLENPEPVTYEINTGDPKKIIKEDPVLKKMPASIKLKAEFKQDALYYKNKQIVVNSPIDFKTGKYQVEAIYLPPENKLPPKEKANIETKLPSVSQLNDIINRITTQENRLANLQELKSRITTLDNRIITLDNRIITLGSRITALGELNNRIARLEEEVNLILSSPKIKKLLKIKE